jgi:hypothetical protein
MHRILKILKIISIENSHLLLIMERVEQCTIIYWGTQVSFLTLGITQSWIIHIPFKKQRERLNLHIHLIIISLAREMNYGGSFLLKQLRFNSF